MKNTNAPVKVTFDKYGEPKEVLNIEPLAIVKPGAGEVAVRLLASPVDPFACTPR